MNHEEFIDPDTNLVLTRFEVFLNRIVKLISYAIYTPMVGLFLLVFAVPIVRNLNLYTPWKFELEMHELWFITTLSVIPLFFFVHFLMPFILPPIQKFGKQFEQLFPPKESICRKCGKTVTLIHGYKRNSDDEDPQLQVCSDCLMKLLDKDLQKYEQPLVFTEPLLEEHYGFVSFADRSTDIKLLESLETYLPLSSAFCITCKDPAQYAWVPNEAIIPGKYTPMAFYPKERYAGSREYCRTHLLERLKNDLTERNHRLFLFDTVRTKESGYFF